MLLHPNFEYTSDADNNTNFSNNDWIKDVSVNGQLKFIVEHHNTERVSNHDEYVIVEFEFLSDIDAQELGCFQACRSHNLVIVLLQLCLCLFDHIVSPNCFHKGIEKLRPVTGQVEPVLPSFNPRFVLVFGAIYRRQHQI